MINIAQIGMLVGVTGVALAYRFINPDHVSFYFSNPASVIIPSSASHMLFQATIAILVLVGFESVTALTAEAKNPKDVPKAIILSLVIQGAFCYLLGVLWHAGVDQLEIHVWRCSSFQLSHRRHDHPID